jgi:hypothetical protein
MCASCVAVIRLILPSKVSKLRATSSVEEMLVCRTWGSVYAARQFWRHWLTEKHGDHPKPYYWTYLSGWIWKLRIIMRNMNSNHADNMNNAIDETGLRRTASNHIAWRKDHSHYPRNWSFSRKSYDMAVIVFLEFYTLSLGRPPTKLCDWLLNRTVISTTGVRRPEIRKRHRMN